MPRIAHLSDVHILAPLVRRKGARYRIATRLVGVGRAIDPRGRAKRLSRALGAAMALGAEHMVISGDLTEIGSDAEFEQLAEVLHDAKLPADSVTLVPGNHDAYTSGSAFRRALEGPLAHFASASARRPGDVVERGSVVLLPVDVTRFQSIATSGGVFSKEAATAVERRIADPAFRDKAVVLVIHHSPMHRYRTPVMEWIDGLRGFSHVVDLLNRYPRLSLLHGHLHRMVDKFVGLGSAATRPRVFGAPATCDDRDDAPPRVRLYDVQDGVLAAASTT